MRRVPCVHTWVHMHVKFHTHQFEIFFAFFNIFQFVVVDVTVMVVAVSFVATVTSYFQLHRFIVYGLMSSTYKVYILLEIAYDSELLDSLDSCLLIIIINFVVGQ